MFKPEEIKEKGKVAETINKKFFDKLKKVSPDQLDKIVHPVHEDVFEEIDCLACANCCKTTSPIFYQADIERVARKLRVKPSEFIDQYLHLDEDNDYVLNSSPCPFLDGENYCLVYESRPTACREYPHTNRKRFRQILNLTLKNTQVCPAVYEIVERLKVKLDFGK
ncbi:MAG: YkgJ family cysteine cluster protein [Sporocytophaga sp.]|uniref:YkgJ family cysteine cluster protein n=1 Tax=Sporocytophaga sp. TaxID=2231183 RepID=UPI001B09882F|nr:YkgJ family cysteine cluster protein [Sporocytophaga sp.]MBO9703218.1 YkgJ family cysteine cluster protein [Sporocytophaga sp.]